MENRTIAKEAEKNHVTEKDRDREKDLGLSLNLWNPKFKSFHFWLENFEYDKCRY